ncbi:MAG: hypothetical protein ACJ8F7_10205 [Gemmataceae bacterium]
MKRTNRLTAESAKSATHDRANGVPQTPIEPIDEDVQVALKAAAFCVRHFPTLWTAGLPHRAGGQWIVPIFVRYPTGDERRLGEMTFDGTTFTPVTPREEMARLARELEEDPDFLRRWNEQFSTAVPSRTA